MCSGVPSLASGTVNDVALKPAIEPSIAQNASLAIVATADAG
jgi:hypothetical protein